MTNNSQRVTYLEPPQQVGDDETTIVFTQNMNRLYTVTAQEENRNDEDSKESGSQQEQETKPETTEGSTPAYRHGRCHQCDKPVTTDNLNPTASLTCETCKEINGQEDPKDKHEQEELIQETITLILKDMTSLPSDHPVWRYSNPTEAHCFMLAVIPTNVEKINEFISWYDNQIAHRGKGTTPVVP